jgi:hypothetical protein
MTSPPKPARSQIGKTSYHTPARGTSCTEPAFCQRYHFVIPQPQHPEGVYMGQGIS